MSLPYSFQTTRPGMTSSGNGESASFRGRSRLTESPDRPGRRHMLVDGFTFRESGWNDPGRPRREVVPDAVACFEQSGRKLSHDVLCNAEDCRRKEKKENRRAEKRKEKAKRKSNPTAPTGNCIAAFPVDLPFCPARLRPVALLQSSQP